QPAWPGGELDPTALFFQWLDRMAQRDLDTEGDAEALGGKAPAGPPAVAEDPASRSELVQDQPSVAADHESTPAPVVHRASATPDPASGSALVQDQPSVAADHSPRPAPALDPASAAPGPASGPAPVHARPSVVAAHGSAPAPAQARPSV